VAIVSGSQSGKGVALNTLIPTPKEFLPIGLLKIGDMVFDGNGHLCKVSFVSDVHLRDCYKITFDSGETVVCDDEHRWSVRKRWESSDIIINTLDLYKSFQSYFYAIECPWVSDFAIKGKIRLISQIEKVDTVPTVCIGVDSDTRSYLFGKEFIKTLNTSWGPHWLRREIYDKRGGGDYIAVTASFDLFKLKMLPSMLTVFEQIYGVGRYWTGDKLIELRDPVSGKFLAKRSVDPMWGRIILRSADALGGLESCTAKGLWLDECLAPESKISTENEEITISDIVNTNLDTKVWSYDTATGKWELKPILRWVKLKQKKPLLRIDNLLLTPNHKIWLKDKYVRSDEIVSGFDTNIKTGEETSSDGFVYNIEVEGNHNYIANGILVANCGQDRFTFDAYKALRRRAALYRARLLYTTTLYNLGWVQTQIVEPAINTGKINYYTIGKAEIDHTISKVTDSSIIQFDSIINPAFSQDEFDEARALLPEDEFYMFYKGRKANRRFLIFDNFDTVKHTIPPFEVPASWTRYMGLDFGGAHTCCVYYAEEPITKVLYAYKEYLGGGRTIKDHVSMLLAGEPGVPFCVGGSSSEGQWRAEFGWHGLPVYKPAIIDVDLGINRVYAQHQVNGIIYFNTLHGIIDQKGRYRRKRDLDGETLDMIVDKATFHYLDCERYLVSTIRPGTSIRAKIVRLGNG
jgi:hypothetical protein